MVFGGVSPADVIDTLSGLSPRVYAAAIALHLATYAFRTARFRLLLPRDERPGSVRMLVITATHNLASYLLPAKTGEASYVLYSGLVGGVSASRSLASLLVARFLDAAFMSLWMASAMLIMHFSRDLYELPWLAWGATGLLTISAIFLFLAVRAELFAKLLRGCVRVCQLERWSFGRTLRKKLFTLGDALGHAGRGSRVWWAMLCTLPTCLTVHGFYWILSRDMGMPDTIGLAASTFGSSIANFTNLLPINGAAGAGTQELGWVTGFNQLLGVDFDVALATGIGTHLVQLSNIIVFGFVAHVVMGFLPKRVSDATESAISPPIPMQPNSIVVPLAEGFEEIEAITIIDVLRRADLAVYVAGLTDARQVTGSHGIQVTVDGPLDGVDAGGVRAVVLPGGMPGSKTLATDERVLALLKATHAAGKEVAAVCAAPIALEAAGLLEGRGATSHPSVWSQLASARVDETTPVVHADGVTTSQGPGTSLEFALELVRRLQSPEKADELAAAMRVQLAEQPVSR